jgi:hypothetical protein
MGPLRIIMLVAGVIATLFGLFFLLGAESAISSDNLGDSTLPARLFTRATGAGLIAIGVINLLASRDRGSPALQAIVIGNLLLHLIAIWVDFGESYARNGGIYVGLAVHVIFIIAFGWVLLNWKRLTSA